MTDNITLPRAVGEKVRSALSAWVRIYQFEQDIAALAALDAALEAQEDEALLNEPVAMRYDGDGYGYLYIDSGSGSDWQRRHKDAEPLYLAPPKPEPALVEQLFALAKLTVRRAADPDPWVWDRLDDDGTWKPFNPLIHGPDMWRLEQALRAALAEPEPEPDVADLFARFAAKQKPLDADMAAILHANLDSLYITEDALQEGIDAQDRDLWQRRADEGLLKEYEKRYGKPEPATVEQVIAAHGPSWGPSATPDFFTGFRAAERFHGITKEDDK